MDEAVLPFDVELEAEHEYSLDMLIAELVEDQNYTELDKLLWSYIEKIIPNLNDMSTYPKFLKTSKNCIMSPI